MTTPSTTQPDSEAGTRETMMSIDVAGLAGDRVEVTSEQLGELAARIEGRLLQPGDEGWDQAVTIWNAMVATVPALVVQPAIGRRRRRGRRFRARAPAAAQHQGRRPQHRRHRDRRARA